MRAAALALALVLAQPVDAASGHCFKIWHFHHPQRCEVRPASARFRRPSRPPARLSPNLPAPAVRPPADDDEALRARGLETLRRVLSAAKWRLER